MKRINRFLFALALRTLRFVGVNSLHYDCDEYTFEVTFKDGMNPFPPEPKKNYNSRNIQVRYKKRYEEGDDICEQLQQFYNPGINK